MNVVERSHVADHLWVWRVRLSEALGTTTMGDEVEHQVSLLVLYRNKLKTYKVVVVAGSSVSTCTTRKHSRHLLPHIFLSADIRLHQARSSSDLSRIKNWHRRRAPLQNKKSPRFPLTSQVRVSHPQHVILRNFILDTLQGGRV